MVYPQLEPFPRPAPKTLNCTHVHCSIAVRGTQEHWPVSVLSLASPHLMLTSTEAGFPWVLLAVRAPHCPPCFLAIAFPWGCVLEGSKPWAGHTAAVHPTAEMVSVGRRK